MFITFEGGEGTGKSTQILMLANRLRAQGIDVIETREPGGTEEAEAIRQLFVSGEPGKWTSSEELLLISAARCSHIRKLIKPALEAGKTVLCDRYVDSTFVYQCLAGNAPVSLFNAIMADVVSAAIPERTIVLDLKPEIGILRSRNRMAMFKIEAEKMAAAAVNEKSDILLHSAIGLASAANEDRFEKMEIEFHRRVREGFLQIAQSNNQRFRVIDATPEAQVVADNVWLAVNG